MNRKLNNLQALRAFAALNVVFFHILGTAASYGFEVNYLKIFQGWGFNGVDIFFVLSGFIMVYILKDGAMHPINFLMERLTRIAPLYWLLTALVLILTYITPSIFRSNISDIQIHSVASFLFISQALLGKSPVLFDGWTLEYEMLFYLCIAIGLSFKKKSLAYLFTILSILFLIAINAIQSVALEFILGMLLANIYLSQKNDRKIQLFCLLVGTAWFASTLILFKLDGAIFSQRVFMYGLPSALIIYGLLGISQIKEGILTKLGDASYSIYLLQVFSIPAFYKFFKLVQGVPNDLLALFCLISTTLGGYLMYSFVEVKLIQRARELYSRFFMKI